jgi:hypothetical protein
MSASIATLFHYPIKGFTPQRVNSASLRPGEAFPGDRLLAVEDGPSGFDPAAPAFVPKMRFAVLAKSAAVASVRTFYEESSRRLTAQAPGVADFEAVMDEAGKAAFARWLAPVLGDETPGTLKVVEGGGHRFLDHPLGHVSIINLASVRDLGERMGREVDPLRFRANLYVEGWPAWAENGWTGRDVALGGARTRVFKPITRCAAPDVDPATAARDMEITAVLHAHYGHLLCGIYVQVEDGGEVAEGDEVEVVR